jgi:hypothetical protein
VWNSFESSKESVDLQLLRDEIEQGDKTLKAIAAEIETRGVEFQAPSRVSELSGAEIMNSKK